MEKLIPPSFATLDKFHDRKLRPGEALSLFTQDLRLLQLAMPGLEKKAKEQLLLHQFMVGLPATMNQQLDAMGVCCCCRKGMPFMAIDSHDPPQGSATINIVNTQSEMSQMKTQIDNLTEQVVALSMQKPMVQPHSGLHRQCFNCKWIRTLATRLSKPSMP